MQYRGLFLAPHCAQASGRERSIDAKRLGLKKGFQGYEHRPFLASPSSGMGECGTCIQTSLSSPSIPLSGIGVWVQKLDFLG